MGMRTSLSLLLSFLICMSILALPSSVQAATPTVYINPPSKTGLRVGDTFPVNVTVADVNLLFAWEFQIYYNSRILNASNWTPGPAFTSPDVMIFNQTWTDNYNATYGLVDIVCTLTGQNTFSGTTTLATLYFTVKSLGTTALHLQNTSLLDNSTPFPQKIPHTTTDGTVSAGGIPGDINGDGKVNLQDLVLLALAYGSHRANYHYQGEPASPNWNANADIDSNGAVGLTDLVILATHYGQHSP
jgi:hypothetical protein